MNNKNIKIGIVTHYYKSVNYGGNLQAYALCKFLNNLGYDAEQICFPLTSENLLQKQENQSGKNIKHIVLHLKNKINTSIYNFLMYWPRNSAVKKIKVRNKKIQEFNESIPHSEFICIDNNFTDALRKYDVFIAGSDQIWNPIGYNPIYFLDFVPTNLPKFSYAASISQDKLPNEYVEKIKKHLKHFTAISVREKKAIILLENLVDKKINLVVDPTLLLTKLDWENVISKRIICDNYIFCYFLGSDNNARKVAEKFSKQKNLKIVTLPYLQGEYRTIDNKFGDYKLFEVSPTDFISLVKYSKYVFTDSFHATVFSEIFEKEYFVFQRFEAKSMANRIYDLTELFNHSERFLDTADKASYENIIALDKLSFSDRHKFDKLRKYSVDFICNNLQISEEMINEVKA